MVSDFKWPFLEVGTDQIAYDDDSSGTTHKLNASEKSRRWDGDEVVLN